MEHGDDGVAEQASQTGTDTDEQWRRNQQITVKVMMSQWWELRVKAVAMVTIASHGGESAQILWWNGGLGE